MSNLIPGPKIALKAKALRYLIVGGIAAVIDVTLFLVLARHIQVLFFAAALSFSAAAVFNYSFCAIIVYRKPLASVRQVFLFFGFALIGLVVNAGMTSLSAEFVGFVGLPLAIAKMSGIAAALAVNFTENTFLSFRDFPTPTEPTLAAENPRRLTAQPVPKA